MADIGSREQAREETKRDMQEANLAAVRIEGAIGGLVSFNMEYGFVEGLVRGLRSGFLKAFEYKQLCQCNTFEDVKLVLGDTDYAPVLQNLGKLTRESLLQRIQQKWVDEFLFMRAQAVGALATFMDFITYEHLIDSFSFIVAGIINGNSSPKELLAKCHPLGRSPHLKSLLTFEQFEGADGLVELYRTVLVDMPIGPYFSRYFAGEVKGDQPSREIARVYNEVEVHVITDMIKRLWMEDFHNYCKSLRGETWAVMKELLEFSADRRAITIVNSSFTHSALNDPVSREKDRQELFCTFGSLYPDATHSSFRKVGEPAQLQQALSNYPKFKEIFKSAQEGGAAGSIEDVLRQMEVKQTAQAFDGQSHFASFYAFVNLKKQEYENLNWIFTCIESNRSEKDKNLKWINIF
jgi:V-type H+-transporting ATPase subunit d